MEKADVEKSIAILDDLVSEMGTFKWCLLNPDIEVCGSPEENFELYIESLKDLVEELEEIYNK